MLLLWSGLLLLCCRRCSGFLRSFLRFHRLLLPLRLLPPCGLWLRSFLCVFSCSGCRCRSSFRLWYRSLLLSPFRYPSCGQALLLWSEPLLLCCRHCSGFLRFFLLFRKWLLPLRLSLLCGLWLRSSLCVSFCSECRCKSSFRLWCRSLLLLPFRRPSCGLMLLLWSGPLLPCCRRCSDFLQFFRLSRRWLLPSRLLPPCGLWLRSSLCVFSCSGCRCRSPFRLQCRLLLLSPFRYPNCVQALLLWSEL